MFSLARIFITLGLIFLAIGFIVAAFSRFHLPLGRLPGDLSFRGRNWSLSIPLATSLLVSVVISFILWLINRLSR